ncbi:MAG: ice-binding family protein [Candidatus Nomurabacteria bacterium]|nr:ice-binding family protein [Candidatus Nomurabacteria bacterium]
MKKFKFNKVSVVVLVFVFMFGMSPSITAYAATAPNLGAAESFSVLAQTLITGISTISGDVGMNTSGAGVTALTTGNVAGSIYATDLVAPSEGLLQASVQANAVTANANMLSQGSPVVIGTALDGLTLVPGVYDLGAGQLNGGILHLNGAGVYIFRTSSSLISSGSIDFQNGARACDLFWSVNSLATINGSSFAGTIIAGTGVHFGANVNLDGRALAIGGDVTMLSGTISGPTCTEAPAPVVTPIITPTPELIPAPTAPVFEPTISIISTPVVVAPVVPKLPKTGFPPQTWYEFLLNNILNLFK